MSSILSILLLLGLFVGGHALLDRVRGGTYGHCGRCDDGPDLAGAGGRGETCHGAAREGA